MTVATHTTALFPKGRGAGILENLVIEGSSFGLVGIRDPRRVRAFRLLLRRRSWKRFMINVTGQMEGRGLRVTSTKARTNQRVDQRQPGSGQLTIRPTSEGLDTSGNAWRACFKIGNKQNSHAAHTVVSGAGAGGVKNRERKEPRDARAMQVT